MEMIIIPEVVESLESWKKKKQKHKKEVDDEEEKEKS
jgi:hypothetical protein